MGSSCSAIQPPLSRTWLLRKPGNSSSLFCNKQSSVETFTLKHQQNGGEVESESQPMDCDHCDPKRAMSTQTAEDDPDEEASFESELRVDSNGNRQLLSATSTYLPGTSISLSHIVDDLPPLEMKPLPDLESLSKEVRDLLLGRVTECSVRPKLKEIFVYVCADYQDTEEEQNALMESVFPLLRRRCAEHGYTLNILNLHWGLPGDCLDYHNFKDLCLDTFKSLMDTDRLITVMLLNSYFEPPPPPSFISEVDFDRAVSGMTSADDRELFHKWYLVDENAVPPCYVLQPVSEYLPAIHSSEEDLRQNAMKEWRYQAQHMVKVLQKVLDGDLRERYLTSVIEDLLHASVSGDHRLKERCLLVQRAFLNHPTERRTSQMYHVQRISQLRTELELKLPDPHRLYFAVEWFEGGLMSRENSEHARYVGDMCESVAKKLGEMIKTVLDEDAECEERTPCVGIELQLHDELLQQKNAIRSHLHRFQNRPSLLASIREYVLGPSRHPFVLHGAEGRGKSALVATTTVLSSQWLPYAAIIVRLVGTSPESNTQEQILRSICEQWCVLYGEHPALASRSIMEHSLFFSMLLQKVGPRRPLVIMLDGLDQVAAHSSRSLKWLPTTLPEYVKVILTVRDDSKEMMELKELFQSEESVFLEIPNLSPRESLAMVEDVLQTRYRRLTESQLNVVRFCLLDSSYPRYCHLLGHLGSKWHSIKGPEELMANRSLGGLVTRSLRSLGDQVGNALVTSVVGLLLTTKQGLTDGEVLDTLSDCEPAGTEASSPSAKRTVRHFPAALWLLIRRHLALFLRVQTVDGVCLTTWRCDTYRTLCKAYIEQRTLERCSRVMVDYFQGSSPHRKRKNLNMEDRDEMKNDQRDRYGVSQPTVFGDTPNRRKLEELTLLCISQNIPVRECCLMNANWLHLRLSCSDPYQVLEDIKMYRRKNPDDREFDVMREVIQLSSYALRYDGSQLYSQLYGRLEDFFTKSDNCSKYPSVKALFNISAAPPVPSLLPLGSCLKGPTYRLSGQQSSAPDPTSVALLSWLRNDLCHVVSLSDDGEEIIIWDIYRHMAARTLVGLPTVHGMRAVDRNRILVLCDGHFRVYDVNQGELLTRIEDVVDTTLPVYVMNNGQHILAMSAGRSDVLLLDVVTGHVESRLHAGEDRYLDSLLVSRDSKICVCGDALQKPFPLLVWEIESGRLVQEFRLPHHEFLTRLADLSDDGCYLASATKELLDSTPNYVVVYNIPKGSLLWTWRMALNTTGVAVCVQSESVVIAAENALLMVVDLITGKKRFVLRGHSAPVDSIQRDRNGTRCLTYDSTATDRSIRLWDLILGHCIAVFTPDQAVSCCLLSDHGNVVALGMVGRRTPTIISLCHKSSVHDGRPEYKYFGTPQLLGSVFNVSEGSSPAVQ